jgi:hypothetical protein
MTTLFDSTRSRPRLVPSIPVLLLGLIVCVAGAYWIQLSSPMNNPSQSDKNISAPAPVIIKWSTRREEKTVGYIISRAEKSAGPFARLNPQLIPAVNDPYLGGTYVYTDTETMAGVTYYYRLEDVASDGKRTAQDPIAVTARVNSPTLFGWVISESTYPLIGLAVVGVIGLVGIAIWIIIQR